MLDFARLAGDSLHSHHNDQEFSTKDRDNDNSSLKSGHCSRDFKGAWWYNTCYDSNLNGVYQSSHTDLDYQGMEWQSFHPIGYSMKKSEMKIRPTDFLRQ